MGHSLKHTSHNRIHGVSRFPYHSLGTEDLWHKMLALRDPLRGQEHNKRTFGVNTCGSHVCEYLIYYLMGCDEISLTPNHRILGHLQRTAMSRISTEFSTTWCDKKVWRLIQWKIIVIAYKYLNPIQNTLLLKAHIYAWVSAIIGNILKMSLPEFSSGTPS